MGIRKTWSLTLTSKAFTVVLISLFTKNIMDVSLNIPKATRTMKTTNIALKTTIKMLPKMKKIFQIFEILRGFRVIFEKVGFFENS